MNNSPVQHWAGLFCYSEYMTTSTVRIPVNPYDIQGQTPIFMADLNALLAGN